VPPDVVACGENVRAGCKELLRELRGQPEPVGGVLAVDDAEVGAELMLQLCESGLDRAPPGRREDVREEKNPQGVARALAGCTWMCTCWPLSCV
jgi:hypothetical protein